MRGIISLFFLMFLVIVGVFFMTATFGELDKNINVTDEYHDVYNTTSSITRLSVTNMSWLGFIIFVVIIVASLMLLMLFLRVRF